MKEAHRLTLGVDLGTSKVAAVVVDHAGDVLAHSSEEHRADVPVGKNRSEQDVTKIFSCAANVVRGLPENLRRQIGAVGVTGQMHGVVPIASGGSPAGHLVTWQDGRCREDAGFLDALGSKSGLQLHSGFGFATLAWMLQHDAAPANMAAAASVHDLFVSRLCGSSRPVTDPTTAASWGGFDLCKGSWDRNAQDALNLPDGWFPQILPSGSRAGTLCSPSAHDLGLVEGIPVGVALGDNQASLLATIQNPAQEISVTVGTGCQLSLLLPAIGNLPDLPPTCELRPFPRGMVAIVAAPLAGGAAWQWLGQSVHEWMIAFEMEPPAMDLIFQKLNVLGMEANVAYHVSPSFVGERHHPDLLGEIRGLGMNHLSLGSLARGLAAGIFENMRQMVPAQFLEGRNALVGSGNALRRNPLLRQMAETTFGLPLRMSEAHEEAAAGAAMLASDLLKN